ncbi:B12 binding protein [Motilibacter peucedani]|uniref:B12 binding protein n=1 Tax=Motilibacter peucedani TaxID=598650 RepID=A0A420XKY2_9ACTN|nr:MerR family transcriptional regulator [Motilibacter peucedani]RKS69314.1 B12 binding protein [Motilibacter peucedani]
MDSEAVLSVAAVARRLGVAPATLRTWDRRYDLGPSGHTAGSHRRYTAHDLERLTLMRRLTLEGVPPAEAARVALAAEDVTPQPATPVGGGRVLAMPGGSAATRGLARAAMALDDHACRQIIRTTLDAIGVVATWDQLLRPVLAGVGERWAQTGEGVEVEHLLSEVSASVFRTGAEVANPLNGRPVLLAGAPQELHILPLHVLAAALAERQVASRVLGAQLPARALVDAVTRSGPAAVVLWAQRTASADVSGLASLPGQRPAPAVFAGGPGWDAVELPEGARRLESLGDAVETMVGLVTARRA